MRREHQGTALETISDVCRTYYGDLTAAATTVVTGGQDSAWENELALAFAIVMGTLLLLPGRPPYLMVPLVLVCIWFAVRASTPGGAPATQETRKALRRTRSVLDGLSRKHD